MGVKGEGGYTLSIERVRVGVKGEGELHCKYREGKGGCEGRGRGGVLSRHVIYGGQERP